MKIKMEFDGTLEEFGEIAAIAAEAQRNALRPLNPVSPSEEIIGRGQILADALVEGLHGGKLKSHEEKLAAIIRPQEQKYLQTAPTGMRAFRVRQFVFGKGVDISSPDLRIMGVKVGMDEQLVLPDPEEGLPLAAFLHDNLQFADIKPGIMFTVVVKNHSDKALPFEVTVKGQAIL